MKPFSELIAELVEKKTRLEQLKREYPEMTEAIQLAEEYAALFEEIQKRCNMPHFVPYPICPPILPPYWITCGSADKTISASSSL